MKRRWIALSLTGAAVIFAVVAGLVVFANSFDLAGYVERRATSGLARSVDVGRAHLALSFNPQLVLENIRIDNPPGYSIPTMVEAGYMRVGIDLWKFIRGQVVLPHVVLEDATVRLERTKDGRANWRVTREGDESAIPSIPQMGRFEIRNTQIRYRDAPKQADMRITVLTQEAGDPGEEPNLLVKGTGTYLGGPAKIDIKGGSMLALRSTSEPYPLDATIVVGPTQIKVTGDITDIMNVRGLNLDFAARGRDAAELYPLLGVAMFPTPPYAFTSHLDRDGARWLLKDFEGTFGRSDVAGHLGWDLSDDIPRLEGELRSKTIHLADLAGFIGAAPGDAKMTSEQRRAASRREVERRAKLRDGTKQVAAELVIPDNPIRLDKLNSMNANVSLRAEVVERKGFPLDTFATDLHLENGVLNLKPLTFGADTGQIAITLRVDARKDPAKTDIAMVVERFPLHRLTGEIDKDAAKRGVTPGVIGGRMNVQGTGNSMHEILADGNGEAHFLGQGGQLSQLRIELLDLDFAEALGVILGKDKPVPIRCVAIGLGMQSGVVTSRALVLDTIDSTIIGEGSANLGTEILNFKLDAKPKDGSLLAIRAPVLVGGTLARPSFTPDPGRLAVRAAEVLALGALLTPLAGIIPLLGTGGQKDVNCATMTAQPKS